MDKAVTSETKKKLKCTKELSDYILIYSGVKQEEASAAVALFTKNYGEIEFKTVTG